MARLRHGPGETVIPESAETQHPLHGGRWVTLEQVWHYHSEEEAEAFETWLCERDGIAGILFTDNLLVEAPLYREWLEDLRPGSGPPACGTENEMDRG